MNVSNGCIRMKNQDAKDLFDTVPTAPSLPFIKTVLSEPLKAVIPVPMSVMFR